MALWKMTFDPTDILDNGTNAIISSADLKKNEERKQKTHALIDAVFTNADKINDAKKAITDYLTEKKVDTKVMNDAITELDSDIKTIQETLTKQATTKEQAILQVQMEISDLEMQIGGKKTTKDWITLNNNNIDNKRNHIDMKTGQKKLYEMKIGEKNLNGIINKVYISEATKNTAGLLKMTGENIDAISFDALQDICRTKVKALYPKLQEPTTWTTISTIQYITAAWQIQAGKMKADDKGNFVPNYSDAITQEDFKIINAIPQTATKINEDTHTSPVCGERRFLSVYDQLTGVIPPKPEDCVDPEQKEKEKFKPETVKITVAGTAVDFALVTEKDFKEKGEELNKDRQARYIIVDNISEKKNTLDRISFEKFETDYGCIKNLTMNNTAADASKEINAIIALCPDSGEKQVLGENKTKLDAIQIKNGVVTGVIFNENPEAPTNITQLANLTHLGAKQKWNTAIYLPKSVQYVTQAEDRLYAEERKAGKYKVYTYKNNDIEKRNKIRNSKNVDKIRKIMNGNETLKIGENEYNQKQLGTNPILRTHKTETYTKSFANLFKDTKSDWYSDAYKKNNMKKYDGTIVF